MIPIVRLVPGLRPVRRGPARCSWHCFAVAARASDRVEGERSQATGMDSGVPTG